MRGNRNHHPRFGSGMQPADVAAMQTSCLSLAFVRFVPVMRVVLLPSSADIQAAREAGNTAIHGRFTSAEYFDLTGSNQVFQSVVVDVLRAVGGGHATIVSASGVHSEPIGSKLPECRELGQKTSECRDRQHCNKRSFLRSLGNMFDQSVPEIKRQKSYWSIFSFVKIMMSPNRM